jgi:hypothetical protein
MSAIARALDNEGRRIDRGRRVPLTLYVVGSTSRLALWILTGAVLCVLLIVAANVTSSDCPRRRPARDGYSLGSARCGRIVRQLLIESVTLAAISAFWHSGMGGIRLAEPRPPRRLAE